MRVEIFSDVACPFCYIGKHNFETALAAFEDKDEVEVLWRSFQLSPDMPKRVEGDMHDYLSAKFGISREEAMAMNDRVLASAHGAGLEIDFEKASPANTFDAHRMLQLATERGRASEMAGNLFRAYFTGSASVADPDDLTALAVDAGIERELAAEVANGDAFADRVTADIEQAAELGLTGVPAFVIDRSLLVSGAQPPEVLLGALRQAAEAAPAAVQADDDAESCSV